MSDPVCRDGVELGRLRLPVTVTSPKAARDLIGIMVAQWGLGQEVDFVARLAVCELVTNTLYHCAAMPGSTVLVVISRVGHLFRVDVHDGTTVAPRIRRPADTEETGRGLALVSALTHDCGHYLTPFGKAVWFSLKAHWPVDHVV
ncbi:ATP-binding protein [Actinomadura scrupuli]|uniref:ATP-binding protein n=1 Tax=Actinomadura scrupuli TaxID=559629 RepID=UPI003D99BA69